MALIKIIAGIALICISGPAISQNAEDGRELFITYCATCHGDAGRGDGPMMELLVIPPADLTALQSANNGVFPIAWVVRQIDGRDPLLAHGGAMPLYGQMFPSEDVAIASETGQPILTSQAIADLTAWLATIQD